MSAKGIDESLHEMGGIADISSKNGVFSRTQKRQFEGARESEGFSTWLEGLETLQGVTKSSRTNSSSRAQESTTKNRISIKQGTKREKFEMRLKAPRAQGGKGLLSHTISVQHLKNP